jgi:hypothetical protein
MDLCGPGRLCCSLPAFTVIVGSCASCRGRGVSSAALEVTCVPRKLAAGSSVVWLCFCSLSPSSYPQQIAFQAPSLFGYQLSHGSCGEGFSSPSSVGGANAWLPQWCWGSQCLAPVPWEMQTCKHFSTYSVASLILSSDRVLLLIDCGTWGLPGSSVSMFVQVYENSRV